MPSHTKPRLARKGGRAKAPHGGKTVTGKEAARRAGGAGKLGSQVGIARGETPGMILPDLDFLKRLNPA